MALTFISLVNNLTRREDQKKVSPVQPVRDLGIPDIQKSYMLKVVD